ncbi:MAG: DNA repair exonuclease [Lautropia sp.]|nr:DNA repair exonuclease [Lautropia sp.]
MKFIHTADLHLDSPLRGLSSYPDAPAERLRTATRDAFAQLVGLAIDEQVDFMVIAGDVYDGDWKDFNTGLFFVRQMGRLRQAGIPVFLLWGNHDAESEMTRSLDLPDNVHVFSSRKVESFRLPDLGRPDLKVALHGRSFKQAATTDNLVPGYPGPVAGWLNIGVLHTALEGNAEHARYAPCSVAELQAKGYQYWALGHVHEYWLQQGEVSIAYAGNLQGRHIREAGARGALLVSADDDEITDIARVEVDVLRWHELKVDVSAEPDMRAAVRAAGRALDDLLAQTPAQLPLAVRVVFFGRSAAHDALMLNDDQLRHEVIAQAVALDADRIWIEKVKVHTGPQRGADDIDAGGRGSSGAVADLKALAQGARHDPAFIQSLLADWRALLEKLPAEVRQSQASSELYDLIQGLQQEPDTQIAARLNEAIPLLVNRVLQADQSR